ncbi:MAG TPA: TolC family protein [Bacteroidales bacterium]|nr:TolC family protein [Bacteroidales bacterium]
MKTRDMKSILFIILVLVPAGIRGQDILDEYIKSGLTNNLALKQKESEYRLSIEALREARALFYPDLSFNARYTVSDGGRVINLPVGDLLNPVYSTLNALTSSHNFPAIENQQIRFLRPHEHETKLRLIQPVFNTDIYYNSKIKKEMTGYGQADVNQYRRELVSEIKKAYYNLSMADGIYSMLQETRKVLSENVRVNRRLVENDKVTRDVLYRSEAELGKFDQDLQEAEKQKVVAAAYFNFLLNRPLTDSVIIKPPVTFPRLSDYTGDYTATALANREEIKKLGQYGTIADLNVKRNQSGVLPDMFLAIDYGYQGETYEFNREAEYAQASAILKWNLFKGFENRSKIRQARIDREIVESELEEAKKQIGLQVLNTMNEMKTSEKGIAAAESTLANAREAFRLTAKRYDQGQASLLEYLDARSTLTRAEESLIISKCRYLSSFAEFEKVTAVNKY